MPARQQTDARCESWTSAVPPCRVQCMSPSYTLQGTTAKERLTGSSPNAWAGGLNANTAQVKRWAQKPLCFCKQLWHYESTSRRKLPWIKWITSWVSLNYTESETNGLITKISLFQEEKIQDISILNTWSQLGFRIPKYQHGGTQHFLELVT